MVSSVTDAQKFMSKHWLRLWDFDPDATTETLISVYNTAATPKDGWLDMSEFSSVLGVYKPQVGTHSVSMKLVVATSSNQTSGATTYTAVKSQALTQVTLADNYILEFDVSEVQSLTTTTGVLYCNMTLALGTAANEGVAGIIMTGKRGFQRVTAGTGNIVLGTTGVPVGGGGYS